jgi:glyoxylase-like metal-dependent hydrolase (beta-lactamase superfamily II)
VIFRQFCTSDEEISYLVADPVSRYAALLDPHLHAERDYLDVICELDLRLVYVIETHAHESHHSAAPVLRAETGARLIAHSAVDCACVDMHVTDDECIFVGEEVISVMETPGHSACSLSYVWRERVFTGHTLLAGATGPCQRADADASQMFDSVRERLFGLPDETLVYPGRVTGKRQISSIGQERTMNIDLRPQTTRERFMRQKQIEARYDRSTREGRLEANKSCENLH